MSEITSEEIDQVAAARVELGIRWLDENAPYDWQRRLLDVDSNGWIALRFKFNYDNEHPLALAFEPRADLARSSDEVSYVTFGSVVRHFKLSERDLVNYGFEYSDAAEDPIKAENGALERGWRKALLSGNARPSHIPRRHYPPFNIVGESSPTFRRWLKTFRPGFLLGKN